MRNIFKAIVVLMIIVTLRLIYIINFEEYNQEYSFFAWNYHEKFIKIITEEKTLQFDLYKLEDKLGGIIKRIQYFHGKVVLLVEKEEADLKKFYLYEVSNLGVREFEIATDYKGNNFSLTINEKIYVIRIGERLYILNTENQLYLYPEPYKEDHVLLENDKVWLVSNDLHLKTQFNDRTTFKLNLGDRLDGWYDIGKVLLIRDLRNREMLIVDMKTGKRESLMKLEIIPYDRVGDNILIYGHQGVFEFYKFVDFNWFFDTLRYGVFLDKYHYYILTTHDKKIRKIDNKYEEELETAGNGIWLLTSLGEVKQLENILNKIFSNEFSVFKVEVKSVN